MELRTQGPFFVFPEFVETNEGEVALMTTGYRSGSCATLLEVKAAMMAVLPWLGEGARVKANIQKSLQSS